MTRFYSPSRGRSAHLTTRTHYTVVNFSKQMHRTQELHLALVGKLICIVGSTFCLKGWSVFCFTLCWVLYHDKTKPATPFWLDSIPNGLLDNFSSPSGEFSSTRLSRAVWPQTWSLEFTSSLWTSRFPFTLAIRQQLLKSPVIIVTDVSSFNQIGAAFS